MRYKIKEKYLVKLKNYLNELVSNSNNRARNNIQKRQQ